MKILFLLLSSAAAWGQITASPAAITVYMRTGNSVGLGWTSTRAPKATAITISGSGAWNISRGGAMSGDCFMANGYCFNASTSATASLGAALPTGSGPGTIYLYWNGLGTEYRYPVGTQTGTLTVGSTVIDITLVMLPNLPYDYFAYNTGYPSGCTNSNPGYSHLDTCTITNERPTSTALAIPAPGGSYVDPQFGNAVARVTPSGNNIEYGAVTAFSAAGTYVLTSNPSGQVNAFSRASGTLAYGSIPTSNMEGSAYSRLLRAGILRRIRFRR